MSGIHIDTRRQLSQLSGRPFGININYCRDHDGNRPAARPLLDAIREMGAGHLRYPGGEKSDWVLFERGKPKPLDIYVDFARGHQLMDLDDFIALCRQAGAQPHVVVAYDSLARTGVSEDAYLENALGLLRYANMERGYGVTYWEIGNENWHNQTAAPEDMARIVSRFARAMKALCPDIQICACGAGEDWWRRFLPLAGQDVDCLVVSQYSCMDWGGYSYFPAHQDVDLVGNARQAISCLQKYLPERAQDIKVIIAELNAKDYADLFDRPHWADDNNMGHSLVTFCLLAQMLQLPEVAYGMLWNTRWMDQDEEALRIWYGLGRDNLLLPSALPLMLLGRFLKENMLACQAPPGLLAYATGSAEKDTVTVFVVNKAEHALPLPEVTFASGPYQLREAWAYGGKGADDLSPQLKQLSSLPQQGDKLPPVSITVLSYERN